MACLASSSTLGHKEAALRGERLSCLPRENQHSNVEHESTSQMPQERRIIIEFLNTCNATTQSPTTWAFRHNFELSSTLLRLHEFQSKYSGKFGSLKPSKARFPLGKPSSTALSISAPRTIGTKLIPCPGSTKRIKTE